MSKPNSYNFFGFFQSIHYETMCSNAVRNDLLKENNPKSGLCALMVQMQISIQKGKLA